MRPTAELFDVHEADLFGYAGLQRVEAVYIPNRFDTDIIWTGIVAHDGNADLWHYELEAPVTMPTATLPLPVQPPSNELAQVKNQAKGSGKKKADDGTR